MLLGPLRLHATNSHKCMAARSRSSCSLRPVFGLLGLTCCLSTSALWAVAESSVTQTIIACVGDSITYSGGGKDYVSYPQNLQNALGPSFEVLNFGQSGATASPTNEQYSTAFRDLYNEALESDADVFVIQLGTNDAKTRYWNATIYRASMHAFLDSFEQLPQSPYLMLGIPPPYVIEDDSWHEPATNAINTQLPVIIPEIANERGIPYANHYKAFGGFENYNEQYYFLPDDGIHPNPLGYERIAWEVYQGLKAAFFPGLTYVPTNCPTSSPIKGPSVSHSPSYLPTVMSLPIPTPLPSYAPSYGPTPARPLTATPTHGPPAVGPTIMPTRLPSPMPPMRCPTLSPTTEEPSHNPTPQPTGLPSSCPSQKPTALPVPVPTALPSLLPSESPSPLPSELPSLLPSASPSFLPSESPSLLPSESPSLRPSASPSHLPSVSPSVPPSVSPSRWPSLRPSRSPSRSPSLRPITAIPSRNPSVPPATVMPTTARPSSAPTIADVPMQSPTQGTMSQPSSVPSSSPALRPTTFSPSASPTNSPSTAPTATPSEPLTNGPPAVPTTASYLLPSEFPTLPTLGPSTRLTRVPSTLPSATLQTTVGTAILSGIAAENFGAAEAGAFESSVKFLLNLGGSASVFVLAPHRSGVTPSTATLNRRLDVSTTVTFEILAPASTASIGEALQRAVENGTWTYEIRNRGNETALVNANVVAVDVDFTHQPSNAPASSQGKSSAGASSAIRLTTIVVVCAIIFAVIIVSLCAIWSRCSGRRTHMVDQKSQQSDHGRFTDNNDSRQECDDESRIPGFKAATPQQIRTEVEEIPLRDDESHKRAPSERSTTSSSGREANELGKEAATRNWAKNSCRIDRPTSSNDGPVTNVESPMPAAIFSNPRVEIMVGSAEMTRHNSTSLRPNSRDSWATNISLHGSCENLDETQECQPESATATGDHGETHHHMLCEHRSKEGGARSPESTQLSDNRPEEVVSTTCSPDDVKVALPNKSDDQYAEQLPFAPYSAEVAEALSLLNPKPQFSTTPNGRSPESVEVDCFDVDSEFSSPTQYYQGQTAA